MIAKIEKKKGGHILYMQTRTEGGFLLFREFTLNDLVDIARLHRGGLRQVGLDVGRNCFEHYADLLYPPAFLGSLQNPNQDGCLIVAEYIGRDQSQLIGMAGYKAVKKTNGHKGMREIRLTRISVEIRFGGLGLGSWLVKLVMALALTREAVQNPNYELDILPFTPFVLSTTNRQAWSRFYGRLGFSEDGSLAARKVAIRRTLEFNAELEKKKQEPIIFICMRREISKLALIEDLLIPLEVLKQHPSVQIDLPLPVARWVTADQQVLPNKPEGRSLICDVNKLDPYSMVVRSKVYKMTDRMFQRVYDKIRNAEVKKVQQMMRALSARAVLREDERYVLSTKELQIIDQWKKKLEQLRLKTEPFPTEDEIQRLVRQLLQEHGIEKS